ncbi:MAG: hypothetical protein RMY29_017235 [Nostoc sp. CreGUA01]|nr:hypothetical protein [Nostoc sp. CreGUA01]
MQQSLQPRLLHCFTLLAMPRAASDRNVCKKSHELGKSWHLSSIYMDLRPTSSSKPCPKSSSSHRKLFGIAMGEFQNMEGI